MNFPSDINDLIKLEHTAEKTENAHLFSAFDKSERLTFSLYIQREVGASSPIMEIFRDDDGEKLTFALEWVQGDYVTDEYSLTLKLSDMCVCEDGGLFFYTFSFDSAIGKVRLSYDGASYRPIVKWYDEEYCAYQLTALNEYKTPNWLPGGIIYQIFVDRFNSSGKMPVKDGAVKIDDWYNGIPQYAKVPGGYVENNCFFGGDLYGVIEKLDYIASFGVNCIYLNPVFEAYSNHKYDTGDYSKIDSMFGGNEALLLLFKEAKKRNIHVILDGVFNHTGADSIYFNKFGRYEGIGAYNSKESKYYEWYDFESYPDKYRCWWGIDILPAVNTECASYNEMMCGENGIVRRYIREGASGYRLDVADELSEKFLKNLYSAVKEENPEALVLGEVWEDASNKISYGKRRHYYRGELDSVMNYPLREAIINYVKTSDDTELFKVTHTLYAHYPKQVSDCVMNILGTHDTERILSVLSDEDIRSLTADEASVFKLSDEQRKIASDRLEIAYLLLCTLPGVPCIYYGDEAGMEGLRDPFNRMPYPWGREDKNLATVYGNIGKMRRKEPLFKDGYFEILEGYPKGCFAFKRFSKSECVYVIINLSAEKVKLHLFGKDILKGGLLRGAHILKSFEYTVVKTPQSI